MVGSTRRHTRIVTNLIAVLRQALRGTPCEALAEGQQIRAADVAAYPDVIVACDLPTTDTDEYQVSDPKILIEVLSASTERLDRGPKWQAYQTIAGLRHYVLVAQNRPYVEMFSRRDDRWEYVAIESIDATLPLDAIGLQIPLPESYDRCFPEAAAG